MRWVVAVVAVATLVLVGEAAAADQSMTNQKLSAKADPSGHTINVYETTGLNPDCGRTGALTFRIIRRPQHGNFSIGAARVYPTYPASNIRSVCNTRAVAGYRALYTSARRYVGPDSAEFQVFWPAGAAADITVPIDVR